jgi:FdrA protein
MSWRSLVVENRYEDSVRLLGLARELRAREGVEAAEVVVGSVANRRLLAERHGLAVEAGPSDVVVAVDAEGEAADSALAAALAHFEQGSAAGSPAHERAPARSLVTAGREVDANVALVSVPGEYAALEAAKALEAGLHVLLFSDHVALADEVALKRYAAERGLLLMGPGAGTSMLAGTGLGFANAVAAGPVGIVAAAGTGAQETACLLDAAGVGVSQIVGVGGRDLSPEVGGAMMLAAARLLAADPATEVILLVSKPPAPEVVARLAPSLPREKPVVAGFVGYDGDDLPFPAAPTLEEAARLAAAAAGTPGLDVDERAPLAAADEARARLAPEQRALRGLYSGGTLCFEALTVLRPLVGPVRSNVDGGDDSPHLVDDSPHLVLDLGEEEFTAGRPHPMVDLSGRIERLLAEAEDPVVACLLLDVVLGYAAHPDPASELAPAIEEARSRARAGGRELAVVAHVCGTDRDPQSAPRQERALREAGAVLAPTNALAARAVAAVIRDAA